MIAVVGDGGGCILTSQPIIQIYTPVENMGAISDTG